MPVLFFFFTITPIGESPGMGHCYIIKAQRSWRDVIPSATGTKKHQHDKPVLPKLSAVELERLDTNERRTELRGLKRALLLDLCSLCKPYKSALLLKLSGAEKVKLYTTYDLTGHQISMAMQSVGFKLLSRDASNNRYKWLAPNDLLKRIHAQYPPQ